MVFLNNHSNGNNDMGPFNGNTRIVAVIALTVAGVFVFLGLVLSLIRAMQQRAAERDLAAAIQQRMALAITVHGNQTYKPQHDNSCKVPWLVVGPDGVCSVAHKLSVEPVDNGNNKHEKQMLATKGTVGAAISTTTSTAGLLANMQGNITQQPSNAESVYDTIQALHGGSISSSAVTQRSDVQQAHQSDLGSSDFAALSSESAAQSGAAEQRQSSGRVYSQRPRPLFTASLETG